MKEAIIVDLNGQIQDVVLVRNDESGVFPIEETPEPTETEPNPSPVIVGYRVAIKPPNGLFQPKFDLQTNEWVEGLTQTQIDTIKNAPKPKTQVDILGEQLAQNRLSGMKAGVKQNDLGKQLTQQRLTTLQHMSNARTMGRIMVRMRIQQLKGGTPV